MARTSPSEKRSALFQEQKWPNVQNVNEARGGRILTLSQLVREVSKQFESNTQFKTKIKGSEKKGLTIHVPLVKPEAFGVGEPEAFGVGEMQFQLKLAARQTINRFSKALDAHQKTYGLKVAQTIHSFHFPPGRHNKMTSVAIAFKWHPEEDAGEPKIKYVPVTKSSWQKIQRPKS